MSRTKGYKCYNIQCGSCIGKTLCGEPEDAALGCENRIISQKTNADRIRAMTDEELCDFLYNSKFTDICIEGCEKCKYDGRCEDRMLEWLKKPAETD